jgi:glycosyltransferase involved in cell wall biosynthesis
VNERTRGKLVVMMSALNEEKTIGDVIDGIPRDEIDMDVAVVVVDDGSTDSTGRIARERGAIVVRHKTNLGLGVSFGDALERSLREGADIIVNMDADGQFNPADIPRLIEPVRADRADFVTATRFQNKGLIPQMPAVKKWGNRRMCTIVNMVTGRTALTDVSCGYRAWSRDAALHLNLTGRFTYTHESIIDLARKGFRITEVPLRVQGERSHGKSRVASSVVRYGARAAVIILRAMCYTRPLVFFGTIAVLLFLLSVGVFAWPLVDWIAHGVRLTGHKFLLGVSAVSLILSFLVGILALVADMLGRQITTTEKLLFYARRNDYDGPPRADVTDS